MNKKVKIYNPQYAKGGITQQDIQKYLMSQQQQQQPQITEDALVDIIYNELTLLGDKAGYVDQGYIDDIADKITQGYNLNSDYIVNLVNEVYSTLAPSDLQYQNATIAQGSPVPKLDMKEGQDDYQEDLTEENLEENVATYDDYYGDDTDMSEMKFGGMTRKKFMQNFIRKAQEGMEQEADQSVMGNNDIQDGRDALVKGFESSVKKSVVKAVAKNQFDKMKQESSYFSEGGFYDPNNLGDDEAYAHHLNLMAQAGKDIFNQPQMTMAKDGREQRRANRDQRRVGKDVQKALNNLPGLYPGGFNVYSMPGQIMPDMSQLGQGMPPFTIEGERNIFGGLKSYKASFEGGLPINFMAGMMSGRRGRGLNMLSSISGYPTSFYSQQSYSNPGQIIYENVNKESLKEVTQNTPGNTSTEVKEGQGSTVPGGSTVPQTVPGVGQTIVPPLVSPRVTVPRIVPPIVPPPVTEIDRRKFQDDLEPVERPGKNYKEWQTKDGGKGISYEGIYKTGMLGTERPARYQVIYKPDGSIDKAKSFVAVSQSDYGGTIYVPWDKQGTFMYEEGGMVMNSNANPFGELQKYVYGGYDPSVAELDGTNLVDPSDPYTRQFANGGTQDEYQQYIDWYNEDAPQEGMRKAAPQSYEQWMAENYPQNKSEQTIVPRYNPQNAALAAQYMSQALGLNRTSPIGTLGRSINPFSISRGMVQKGMPMIAGTNIPFAGAFGPDTRISEIYTEPRRFGKDPVHVKFMVPGQEGPMLGMDWQNQVQQQQQQKGAPEVTSERGMPRDVMEGYGKSKKRGLEDETQIAIRQGERDVRGDVRRAMRRDPDAFYEGEPQEGMTAPMSDADYMAKVKANKVATPNKASESSIKSDPNWDEPYKYPKGSDPAENNKIERARADKAWQMQGIKYDGVGTGADHHVFSDGTPAIYNSETGRYEVDTEREDTTPSVTPSSTTPVTTPITPAPIAKPATGKQTEEFCFGNTCFDVPEQQKDEYDLFYETPTLFAQYARNNNVDWYNPETGDIDLSKVDAETAKKIIKQGIGKNPVLKNKSFEGANIDAFTDAWLKYSQENQNVYGSNSLGDLMRDGSALPSHGLAEKYADFINATGQTAEGKPYSIWDATGPLKSRREGGFIPDYMAYGGMPMYPDGGFVYNNPVDYNTNPVMANQNFFDVNTNNNSIPDYLEWQSTPDQEVDVAYKQKNKINFEPRGLFPFLGKEARNTREALDNNMIDNFNTQNMMSSNSRVAPTEMLSQGRYDINTGREIESGFEGIVGAGLTQQSYSKFGGQLEYEEGGEYDLTEEEIQALIDAGVDITLL